MHTHVMFFLSHDLSKLGYDPKRILFSAISKKLFDKKHYCYYFLLEIEFTRHTPGNKHLDTDQSSYCIIYNSKSH